jgi:hypothetical protein
MRSTSPPEDPKATDQASSGQESQPAPTKRSANILLVIVVSIGVLIALFGIWVVKKPIDNPERTFIVVLIVYFGGMLSLFAVSFRIMVKKNTPEKVQKHIYVKLLAGFAMGLGVQILALGIYAIVKSGIGISQVGLLMEGSTLVLGSMVLMKLLKISVSSHGPQEARLKRDPQRFYCILAVIMLLLLVIGSAFAELSSW